jgi:hypothetical protein
MDQKLWGNKKFKRSLVGQASSVANQQELTCTKKCGQEEEGEFCKGGSLGHPRRRSGLLSNKLRAAPLATPLFSNFLYFFLYYEEV